MGWVFTDGVQDNMSMDDADDVSGASKVPGPTPAKTSWWMNNLDDLGPLGFFEVCYGKWLGFWYTCNLTKRSRKIDVFITHRF